MCTQLQKVAKCNSKYTQDMRVKNSENFKGHLEVFAYMESF